MDVGILYIVATPIGNLRDITFRAVDVLRNADVILAEDTRVTAKILHEYEIDTDKMDMYHHHSKEEKSNLILKYLVEGKEVALVTDAGTPGISDPGNELISFLLEREPNINIVPVPGPSAITTGLSVSGMNVNRFVFLGFLPRKKRAKLFEWLRSGEMPFAFYESPNRIIKTLETISKEFDDPNVFVARELTKKFESKYRGKSSEVIEQMQKDKVKGEMVVVVEA